MTHKRSIASVLKPRLLLICLVLASATLSRGERARSDPAAALPPTTISYYIDMAPAEFRTYSAFEAAYARVGCMEAQRSRGGLVMLDFGESRYSKPAHQWGHNAWSPLHHPPEGLGPWMTMLDMHNAVLAFAGGLDRCAYLRDYFLIELGVNNNNYEPVDMHAAGKVWGRLVRGIDDQLARSRLADRAWAVGAIDAEASFGSVADTVAWIHGYNEETRMARRLPLLDFGDLECSFRRAPPSCQAGWTLYWHWWVAWGNGHSFPQPEIYGSYDRGDRLDDAHKWMRVASWRARSRPFVFAGIMAESEVPPHYRPLYALARLQAAAPRSGVTILPVGTDITWCLLDDATSQRRHDTWCTYDGLSYAPPATAARPFTAADAEALFTRGAQRDRGSIASRKPSPKRLKPSTVIEIANPGKSSAHGALSQ